MRRMLLHEPGSLSFEPFPGLRRKNAAGDFRTQFRNAAPRASIFRLVALCFSVSGLATGLVRPIRIDRFVGTGVGGRHGGG
jgi:hypothetical protein